MTGSDCPAAGAASRPRLERLAGGATAEGVEFERKVAGLAALRARRLGARFQLYSNVAAAHPFDDVVLRLAAGGSSGGGVTYFLQLKHTGAAPLSLKSFTMSKNFCLKKYFDFFLKLRSWHQKKLDPGGTLTEAERLLCEGPMEQCRFVIFTTQERWKAAAICGAADDRLHKMARLVLDTAAADDCVLRFTHHDKKIWDLLNGDANEEIFRQEFLPNLFVYCEQRESSQLDGFITREIQELLGERLPQLDLLAFRYLGFLKEWMRDGAKDFCLTEDSAEVEWYLAQHLREQARQACALDVLQFQGTRCESLRNAMRRNGAIVIQVAGVPAGARAAKVLGLLNAEQRDAWVYVNGDILGQFEVKALVAVCKAHHCRELVLDVDSNSKNVDDLLLAVSGDVRIICFAKMNLGNVPVTTHEDELTFSQLTADAQTRLLERTIKFQGQPVRLRELEGAWPALRAEADGALLGAAALGEAVLGDALPAVGGEEEEGERLYIPRSFQHPSALEPAVLCLASPRDHLVLTGPPPLADALKRLRCRLGWSLDEMNDRWTVLENGSPAKMEAAFDAASSKFSSRNVHWVECLAPPDENSSFDAATSPLVWRRTRGLRAALAALVRPAAAACAREPACVHGAARAPGDAAAWGARAALLAGPPGAGKTCFLRRAAAAARSREPVRWTVFVQAQEHRRVLGRMPAAHALTLAHLEQLLVGAAGAGSSAVATGRGLRAALRAGAAAVFMDGVDELCPAFKDKVLRLLRLLLMGTRAAPVWVSSRPEVNKFQT
ncbi:hypothetical protein R5R35_006088 [Gryllus longicercus]|uniref:NACHT domain-containing protein n=1 Tax=Gryllus longicercus TaxID=2509291 RepID=A0AAN9VTQ9_9ORTH